MHASDGCTRKNWDFHGAEGGQDHASTEVTSVSHKPCKGQKGWMAFFVSSASLIRDMLRGRSVL